MRAIQCCSNDGPKALQYGKVNDPVPGPGAVRIKVAAAGINFADTLMSRGQYQERPPLPFVLGLELAGTIDSAGEGVDDLEPGMRVMAVVDHGAFADYAIAKSSDVVPLPDSMPMTTAAGFAITYGTAIGALDWRAQLQPGERLLVHGAGGGVGVAAVACGRAMGATVTATARGAEKLAIAEAHGAHRTVDSENPRIVDVLREAEPERFDVVFDPVGGKMFEASMRSIAWGGRIVVIGFASGEVPQIPANHLLVKNISVLGLYWGSYRRKDPKLLRQGFAKLFDWHEQGLLGEIAPRVVPCEQGIAAINELANRRTTGKTVIAFGS